MERFTFAFTVLAIAKHYLVWGARRQFSNNKPFTELWSKFREDVRNYDQSITVCQSNGLLVIFHQLKLALVELKMNIPITLVA